MFIKNRPEIEVINNINIIDGEPNYWAIKGKWIFMNGRNINILNIGNRTYINRTETMWIKAISYLQKMWEIEKEPND